MYSPVTCPRATWFPNHAKGKEASDLHCDDFQTPSATPKVHQQTPQTHDDWPCRKAQSIHDTSKQLATKETGFLSENTVTDETSTSKDRVNEPFRT
jgi:hypothetical protein